MKARFSLTIKLTPENAEERADYVAIYKEYRGRVEAALASGNLGLPKDATLRWLLDSRLPQE